MMANLLQMVGYAIVFYYIIQNLPSISERNYVGKLEEFPLFFGTAIFCVEGIAVALPVENRMKNPKEMLGLSGVIFKAFFIVAVVVIIIGFLGYLKYGEDVAQSITLSLPQDEM